MADPEVHHLTADDARRVAVAAQLLSGPRPDELHEVLRHLTLVQHDPTAAVVPSADLVPWGRLGSASYDGRDLRRALETGTVVELHQMLRPAEDIALHRAEMARWPLDGLQREAKDWEQRLADWVEANDGARRDVLDKLHDEGPLPSSEIPDTTVLPWESSGWNNDRNLRRLLDCMVGRGEVAVAGYAGAGGRDKLWDLAERVYPDLPVVPLADALRIRDERRLRALGIARARSPRTPHEPDHVGTAGEAAVVEGVRGTWRVDPSYLPLLGTPPAPRVVLLSPLDRLVMDRRRMGELWDFDYQLEMYKPVAKRRWGYWALPVLVGDRLVGKVDATAERDAGELRVDAVHRDETWDPAVVAAVEAEVVDLAQWLGLVVSWPVSWR